MIDFDPHQMDLTHSIQINGIHSTKPQSTLYDALDNPKTIPITNAIGKYKTEIIIKRKKEIRGFDIIPASPGFQSISSLSAKFSPRSMNNLLISLKNDYDYILIDTPPNWNFFSESAVYAADVVLIPTKHNNIYSLENAAIGIADFIPEVQKARQTNNEIYDFVAVALPIFFNGGKMNDVKKEKIQQEIQKILHRYRSKINLEPYFFPKIKPGVLNRRFSACQSMK